MGEPERFMPYPKYVDLQLLRLNADIHMGRMFYRDVWFSIRRPVADWGEPIRIDVEVKTDSTLREVLTLFSVYTATESARGRSVRAGQVYINGEIETLSGQFEGLNRQWRVIGEWLATTCPGADQEEEE